MHERWGEGALHPQGKSVRHPESRILLNFHFYFFFYFFFSLFLLENFLFRSEKREEEEACKILGALPSGVFLFCLALSPLRCRFSSFMTVENEKVKDYFRELVAISLAHHLFAYYFVALVNPPVRIKVDWLCEFCTSFPATNESTRLEDENFKAIMSLAFRQRYKATFKSFPELFIIQVCVEHSNCTITIVSGFPRKKWRYNECRNCKY